jgi:hypothetical protein
MHASRIVYFRDAYIEFLDDKISEAAAVDAAGQPGTAGDSEAQPAMQASEALVDDSPT